MIDSGLGGRFGTAGDGGALGLVYGVDRGTDLVCEIECRVAGEGRASFPIGDQFGLDAARGLHLGGEKVARGFFFDARQNSRFTDRVVDRKIFLELCPSDFGGEGQSSLDQG